MDIKLTDDLRLIPIPGEIAQEMDRRLLAREEWSSASARAWYARRRAPRSYMPSTSSAGDRASCDRSGCSWLGRAVLASTHGRCR